MNPTWPESGTRLIQIALLICLIVTGGEFAHAQPEGQRLTDFESAINFLGDHEAAVSNRVGVAQPAMPSPVRVILVRYRNQAIKNLKVTDLDGNPLPVVTWFEKGATIAQIPPNSAIPLKSNVDLIIEYIVTKISADVVRIPLAVPEARSSFGDLPVQITLTLPDGEAPVQDTFPALTRRGGKYVSEKLANVPSVVMVHRTSGSETFLGRFVTPSRLSDTAMIVMVFLGSYFWFARSRRKVSWRADAT